MEIKRLPEALPPDEHVLRAPASGSRPGLSARELVGKILFLLPFLARCGGEGRESELGSGSCGAAGSQPVLAAQ